MKMMVYTLSGEPYSVMGEPYSVMGEPYSVMGSVPHLKKILFIDIQKLRTIQRRIVTMLELKI
jgi:hypothetical protein